MSPSPTPDHSPLARLREAAARLNTEGADNRTSVPSAPGPRPEPPRQPEGQPEVRSAPPSPSPWSRSSPPPAAPPAAQPRSAPFGLEPDRRMPLLIGGIVAAVLLTVLVIIGLVAMSNDQEDGTPQSAPPVQVLTAASSVPA